MPHIISLLVVLFVSGCLDGGDPHAPWFRVEVEGRVSYLFGTMHQGADAAELPDAVYDAVAASRLLITEADVSQVDPGRYDELVTLPATLTVEGLAGREDWLRIVDAFRGILPAGVINTIQPWLLHSLLVQSLLDPVAPIDLTLVDHAIRSGVPLGYLETWEEQMQALNALGVADGMRVLVQVARDRELTRRILLEWIDAYQDADVDRLETLALSPGDLALRPRYYDEIVWERTEAWLEPIESELSIGNAFVAVGFVHLLGHRGLVAHLERRGYAVEQVRR